VVTWEKLKGGGQRACAGARSVVVEVFRRTGRVRLHPSWVQVTPAYQRTHSQYATATCYVDGVRVGRLTCERMARYGAAPCFRGLREAKRAAAAWLGGADITLEG
jgi:hypothetical protein